MLQKVTVDYIIKFKYFSINHPSNIILVKLENIISGMCPRSTGTLTIVGRGLSYSKIATYGVLYIF